MKLSEFLAELRQRNVLKVATVYLASGVLALEGGSQLLDNFEAPHWVSKVFSALVIFGFPIACVMAWGFEFKDGSVRPAPPMNTRRARQAGPGRRVSRRAAAARSRAARRSRRTAVARAAGFGGGSSRDRCRNADEAGHRCAGCEPPSHTTTDRRGSARAAYRRDNGYAGLAWRLRAQHAGQERH